MTKAPQGETLAQDLNALGNQRTVIPHSYDPQVLEAFPNPQLLGPGWVSLLCPEFTSLCPKTGQPDFAKMTINYIPDQKIVESKSLKLYLFSFRNHGGFHEECIQLICRDLASLLTPHFVEVVGQFTPRGGIAIWPYASWAQDEPRYQQLRQERLQNFHPQQLGFQFGAPYS